MAKEIAPIRLTDDLLFEESLILEKPKIDNSDKKKHQRNGEFNNLGLKKKVGIIDAEFRVAPLQQQAQFGANIDLIKVNEDYQKEKYLRLQCKTNPDRCEELNQFLIEKKYKDEVMPQIRSLYKSLKRAPKFLYSTIKEEFQNVEDHDQ